MDEGRRFLRYVMPGLVFMGIVALSLIVPAGATPSWLSTLFTPGKFDLATAFPFFFGSGLLGFVFSMLHHQATWCAKRHYGVDYVDILTRVIGVREDWLQALDLKKPAEGKHLSVEPMKAWLLVSLLYAEAAERGRNLARELADARHGIGTILIAQILAILTAIVLRYRYPPACNGTTVLVGLGIILLLWITCLQYRRVRRHEIEWDRSWLPYALKGAKPRPHCDVSP